MTRMAIARGCELFDAVGVKTWIVGLGAVSVLTCVFAFGIDSSVSSQSSEGMVTISGEVLNGTEGAEPPADLTVFALVIDQDSESIVERMETLTSADGSFELDVSSVFGRSVLPGCGR